MDHYNQKMQYANEKDLGKLYQTIYEEKCNQAWLFPDQFKVVDLEGISNDLDKEAVRIV